MKLQGCSEQLRPAGRWSLDQFYGLAITVTGAGAATELHLEFVGFVPFQGIRTELGGVAQKDGQQPLRQRVQAPAMTGLVGIQSPPHGL
jgi:hypothetical protein